MPQDVTGCHIHSWVKKKTKNDLISFLQATNLSTQESTVKALKSTLDKIDPMDYKTIKSVNDETNRIKKALKVIKNKACFWNVKIVSFYIRLKSIRPDTMI